MNKKLPKKAANAGRNDTDQAQSTPKNNDQDSRGNSVMDAFYVVGIGASAGGLAAFEEFFSGMPRGIEPGCAFIIVQHLSPDHKSTLADLVQRFTSLQVLEVVDGVVVRPNCVYIIPSGSDMAILNGSLHLMVPSAPHGQRLSIDYFFNSLAQDMKERAIAIVLSGTGSDAALGLRTIKAAGGRVIVQDPDTTEYTGMPCSAIETGLVDHVLAPARMLPLLLTIASRSLMVPIIEAKPADSKTRTAITKILIILRAQTGHDFSQYKPNTIQRRIERRMSVQQVDSIDNYVNFLQQTPSEVTSLFNDVLIGVTNFFRDEDAFKVLAAEGIPGIFKNRPENSTIRVWVPGCASGEEAYSIAILLLEHIRSLHQNYRVQVFATDLDSRSVAKARAGVYPASISCDLTPERLANNFVAEADSISGAPIAYRINKTVRDILVFSEQDVIKDPPFSKLDLISCRNLLIYMGSDLQKRLIPLFHYSLNPGGLLFLGTSETVGDFFDLFSTIDRKAKLYKRKEQGDKKANARLGGIHLQAAAGGEQAPQLPDQAGRIQKLPLRHIVERELLAYSRLAGALINGQGDILYLHGRTGLYLEPAPGETNVSNILKMAREGLRPGLAAALHIATISNEEVRRRNLSVKTNSHFTNVDVSIRPIIGEHGSATLSRLYLVVLSESVSGEIPPPELTPDPAAVSESSALHTLRMELKAKEDYLQLANNELEFSNAELKSANEELQSVNEEMQSTNEELETSKEELQSMNEELSTVNGELQGKIADLTRVNNDMNNLIAGTGIGTIFVDRSLNIQRYTPMMTKVINLIPGDVGRPIGHIVSNLNNYSNLVDDAQEVLDTLIPKQVEAHTKLGVWYAIRILPYRTLENVIEGVVITFVDITETRKVQDELRTVESHFRLLVESLPQLVWACAPDGSGEYFGPQWLAFTGQTLQRLAGAGWLDFLHPEDRSAFKAAWDSAIAGSQSFTVKFRLRRNDGVYFMLAASVTALHDANGKIIKWFGMDTALAGESQRPIPGGKV